MKKFALRLVLLLVLCSLLVSLPQNEVVKAESTIYIRADGSVEGTDKIQVYGSHYILTGNITVDTLLVDGIYVEKDNIVIDGSGHILEGNREGVGIHLYQRRGVVIKNFHITNWYCGLSNPHSNCTIEGNWITGCDIGINLVGSYNCTFIRNELLNNRDDIFLTTGHSNIFSGNNIGKLVWSTAFLVPGENYFAGNYWGEYEGVDDNGDGFGDTPFKVYWVDYGDRNITCYDNHPLMEPVLVIPEFPSWTSILLLFIVLTVATVIYKRRLLKTPIH